jgi:HEPN domain-containing protein
MSEATREVVRLWIRKAESDWDAVRLLSTHEHCPRDVVCFHCQPHVEKLLKAFLTLQGVEAPRTHNLRRLIQLGEPQFSELSPLTEAADDLTAHGVASRYPDDWREIGLEEMNEIVYAASEFRRILLPRLAHELGEKPDPFLPNRCRGDSEA